MSKKISELPGANPLDGTELLEIVQGGANKQAARDLLVIPGTDMADDDFMANASHMFNDTLPLGTSGAAEAYYRIDGAPSQSRQRLLYFAFRGVFDVDADTEAAGQWQIARYGYGDGVYDLTAQGSSTMNAVGRAILTTTDGTIYAAHLYPTTGGLVLMLGDLPDIGASPGIWGGSKGFTGDNKPASIEIQLVAPVLVD